MRVVIARVDFPNKNNRIYPRTEIEKAITGKTEIYGRIGMGEVTDLQADQISHRVKNLHLEEDLLVGDIEILNTPAGDELRTMLEIQVLDFRLAGIGQIKDDVVSDYSISSINAVFDGA